MTANGTNQMQMHNQMHNQNNQTTAIWFGTAANGKNFEPEARNAP